MRLLGSEHLSTPGKENVAPCRAFYLRPAKCASSLHVRHSRVCSFYRLVHWPCCVPRLAMMWRARTADTIQTRTERPQGRDRVMGRHRPVNTACQCVLWRSDADMRPTARPTARRRQGRQIAPTAMRAKPCRSSLPSSLWHPSRSQKDKGTSLLLATLPREIFQ